MLALRRSEWDRSQSAGWAAVSMQWGAWAGVGMAVTHNLLPRIIKSGVASRLVPLS